MRRIRNYKDFLSEDLFDIFKRIKKEPIQMNKVDGCIKKILQFLKDNQINDWNDFESMTNFDRQIVDQLIDSSVDNMEELKEVRFGIKLKLSDKPQLKIMLQEYEEKEEYEKCSKILQKIKNI